MSFWQNLNKPFFVLAPMADVTDCVFREIIVEIGQTCLPAGRPNVLFTEFVSADGLSHPVARERLLIDLKYSELERPIVAQIFGARPENINKAALLCRELGFDGVDINMGCPDKKVEKQGAGAGLIKNPALAREIIDAAQVGLPVSIKTRLGYNEVDFAWLEMLLKTNIVALTVHLRTRKEMSKTPAHWELVGELRRKLSQRAPSDKVPSRTTAKLPAPFLIANGDVDDLNDARAKAQKYNLDGVMLGRAVFGNPWLFAKGGKPNWPEVFRVMIYHASLFETKFRGRKSFSIMKKFFKAYVSGHPQATDLRVALMSCNSASEVERVVEIFR